MFGQIIMKKEYFVCAKNHFPRSKPSTTTAWLWRRKATTKTAKWRCLIMSCFVCFFFAEHRHNIAGHRVYNNTYKITDFTEILDCPEYSTYGIISRKFPSMNIICVGKVFISSSLKETSVGKCLLSEFDSFVKSRKLTFFNQRSAFLIGH